LHLGEGGEPTRFAGGQVDAKEHVPTLPGLTPSLLLTLRSSTPLTRQAPQLSPATATETSPLSSPSLGTSLLTPLFPTVQVSEVSEVSIDPAFHKIGVVYACKSGVEKVHKGAPRGLVLGRREGATVFSGEYREYYHDT